jgi:hypothetical protein
LQGSDGCDRRGWAEVSWLPPHRPGCRPSLAHGPIIHAWLRLPKVQKLRPLFMKAGSHP